MSLGKSTSTSATKLNQISVQSSTLGKPIAIGWGRGRLSCNLIWYNGFKATAHTTKSGGGKGLGGSSNTTYSYTASMILALCEGTVSSIATVYRDTSVFTSLAAAGLSLASGTPTQPVWGYLTSRFPSEALAYSGIAYVYAQDYALSDSATLPNHSFEVNFAIQGPGVPDANPKDIITDFLTSTSHGVPGWGGGLLGDLADFGNYCLANNLLLSPVLDSQQRASNTIEEWLTATNSAAFWSEGVLKIRPYGDAAATGNGVTWTPDLSPEYDLTENDLQADTDGAVKLDIKDQSDAYNVVQIEFFDRANQYNTAIATAQDLSNIVEFGQRKQDPVTVHSICDAAIAQKAVQLYLQRVLYVRETYTFRLPWSFVLLEPMDLVTLTTTADELQLNRQLVRIIEIEEDEDGLLTFTAEGVDAGVAGAAQYASHSGDGYIGNTDVAPGSVSAPALFVPPVGLTGFDPEVWCAVASTSDTWGGCEVWVSADGTNYTRQGRIDGPARYGVLTATLPAHADPDNANTLSVSLATSKGALTGGTAAEMNAAATLALIGGELIAYQNATLTGSYAYNLAPLRRGLNGTAPAAHASGATFVRLDDAIFKLNYASLNVGETIWVKFPSFNLWGKGLQDLSTVSAYSITVPSADTRYSAALADITAISSDSILAHGSEKQQAYIDYQALLNDYNALSTQYAAKGNPASVATAASDAAAAMTALTNYLAGLSPSWTNTAVDTPIVAATWTSTWGAAYNKVASFRAVLTGRDAIDNFNRLNDTGFTSLSNWYLYATAGVSVQYREAVVNGATGKRVLVADAAVLAGADRQLLHISRNIAYTQSQRYAVQVLIEAYNAQSGTGTIRSVQLASAFYGPSGAQVGEKVLLNLSGQQGFPTAMRAFLEPADVPTGTVEFNLFCRYIFVDGTAGTMRVSISEPMITTARAGQTEFPPYAPGIIDGKDGIPGAPGADGQTLYTWSAYADSADGSVNFTTGSPGARGFQGLAFNKTSASESINPSDYQWAQYRGPASFGLVAHANVAIGPDYVVKTGGTVDWDASAYSSEAFTGGAFISITIGSSRGYMIGLNTDPAANVSWDSLDYGWYVTGYGKVVTAQSGVLLDIGSFAEGDVLSIVYDNKSVTYSQNGNVMRQVAAPPNQRFYLDSSILDLGARISSIKFGPVGAAGADGIPAINGILTNESVTVAAASDGTVPSFAGTGGTFRVFFGLTEVTTGAGASYSVVAASGVSITINSATGAYSISAMSADTGSATLRASYGGVNIDRIYSIAKSRAGANGANGTNGTNGSNGTNAKTLIVLSDRQTIAYDANGSPSPTTQTITFSTNKQNTSQPVYWSITDANGVGVSVAYLSAASGDSVTMTEANFAVARNGTSGVIVTGFLTDGTVISDKISVIAVRAGANGLDALTASLTPSSINVPCSAGGSPKDAILGAQIKAFRGAADVTTVASYAVTGTSNLSGVSVSSSGVVTVSGISGGTSVLTGYADITVSQGGTTQPLRLTYTKVLDGAAYVDGNVGVGAPGGTTFETTASLDLLMGPSGTIEVDSSGGFAAFGAFVNLAGMIDYSLNGGSSWTTAVTLDVNAASGAGEYGNWSGSTSISGSSIGLTTRQTVKFRVQMRRTSAGDFGDFFGTLYANWRG